MVHSGNYENGLKHGYGDFFYLNNRKYEGEWKDGKQNGQGKLYENGRLLYEGYFKNGMPCSEGPSPKAVKESENERVTYENNSFQNTPLAEKAK